MNNSKNRQAARNTHQHRRSYPREPSDTSLPADTVQRRPDKRNAPQGAGERSGQERRAGYSHC